MQSYDYSEESRLTGGIGNPFIDPRASSILPSSCHEYYDPIRTAAMNLNASHETYAQLQREVLLSHLRGASLAAPQPVLPGFPGVFPFHQFPTVPPQDQQQIMNNIQLLLQQNFLQGSNGNSFPSDSLLTPQRTPVLNADTGRHRAHRRTSTAFGARRVRTPISSNESRHSTVSSSTASPSGTSGEPPKKQTNNRPEKLFTCLTCDKSFGYKHVLQNHERTHTGEKPFECSHCQKRFTRDHHLKTHMRLHTGEKPYSCPQCDKTFVQVANLRRHVRVHTGEKPYKCPFENCDSAFSDSNQLRFHRGSVHNERLQEDAAHVCDVCGASFSRRALLNRHQCSPSSSASTTPPPHTIVGHHDNKYNFQVEPMEGITTPDTPESSDGASTPQPRESSQVVMNLSVYTGPVQTEPQDLSIHNKRITAKMEQC